MKYKDKSILLMTGETWLPHRLAQVFIDRVPEMIDWLQEYIELKLAGLYTNGYKEDYITEEDLLKYKLKK
jgi:hypothetical protein